MYMYRASSKNPREETTVFTRRRCCLWAFPSRCRLSKTTTQIPRGGSNPAGRETQLVGLDTYIHTYVADASKHIPHVRSRRCWPTTQKSFSPTTLKEAFPSSECKTRRYGAQSRDQLGSSLHGSTKHEAARENGTNGKIRISGGSLLRGDDPCTRRQK